MATFIHSRDCNIIQYVPLPRAAEGDIDRFDTTKCLDLGKNFHANKLWQNELAILSLQKCMLTALARALAVYCAHSTIDTHCTACNLKTIPAGEKKILSYVNFYKYFMQKPGKAMGSHII